jgi:hypothetical protein
MGCEETNQRRIAGGGRWYRTFDNCDFSNCWSCQTWVTRDRRVYFSVPSAASLESWTAGASIVREMLQELFQWTDMPMAVPPAAHNAIVIESSQVVARFMTACSIAGGRHADTLNGAIKKRLTKRS